jgi:histidinol-phosphate/aromatic aminotransferase/cobyric acid decarboxylase-like protein
MTSTQNRSQLLTQLAELKRQLEENRKRLHEQLSHVAALKKCGRDITPSLALFQTMRLDRDRNEHAFKHLLAKLGV